jgi:hypothetical protein
MKKRTISCPKLAMEIGLKYTYNHASPIEIDSLDELVSEIN